MKLKEILKNASIVICSLVLSMFLCYYILDDIWLHFSIEAFSFIFLRVFVAILLFSLLHLIFNGKLYYFMLDILFISYIVLVISLSFFRISRSEHYINSLNIPLIFSKYLSFSSNFVVIKIYLVLVISIIALFYHMKIRFNLLFVLI